MGLGDMLSSVFGGGNDYQTAVTPFLGKPGASAQDVYSNYQNQNRDFQRSIDQAQNLKLPQNVLNFNAANNTIGQQQGLIDQVLAMGRGEGPNPALDQLRMTTDENVKQAAAQAAANRGINPMLAARMASQNQAAANQQAAGQGALQAAQQQIAAQQLGGGLLGQQVGQQMQQAGMQGQMGLGLLQTRQASEAARRQAQQNYQNMINNVFHQNNATNAGVAAQNAQTSGGYGMGAMSGISSAFGSAAGGMYKGGEVPNPFQKHVAQKLASGGTAGSYMAFQKDNPMESFMGGGGQGQLASAMGSAGSSLGDKLNNAFASQSSLNTLGQRPSLGGMQGPSAIGLGMNSAPAWQRNATLRDTPAPINVPSSLGDLSATPTESLVGWNLSQGGKVLGKAKVEGDSESNDIVPAMLSPGEVVIPRTAMQSPQDAHEFLDRIIQKHQGPSFSNVMKSKEHFHNMAHGGDMKACSYCNGGMA